MHHGENRALLGGKLSAILVAAGSSVGLGNIWRFPYVAGDNGGGAFLVIYIGCVLLLGLPIMLAEFAVGRSVQRNAVGAYRTLNRNWSFLGYNGVLAAFLILGFYFVVSGWTAEYMVHSLTGSLTHFTTAEQYKGVFEAFIRNPWRPVLYTCLFVLATHAIIALGVQKGIERSAKVLMPLLFLVLIALSIHSLLMPGGAAGLKFFFTPDFSKVTATTILVALGQAFFSLSIGLGCMVTYASYFKADTNLRQTALSVTLLDTLVAVLAGVVIFPAVFSVGIEPTSGPSLVFITLPSIFNGMPWSMVWSTIFFLLLVVAALTSTISLHEVITAYFHEEWHLSRRAAAWTTTGATALLATVASLSLGLLSDWTIFGTNFFDSLDFLTANILLPVGGFFTCIFVGWKLDQRILREQLTSFGQQPFRLYGLFRFLLRYFCPAVLLLVFLDNLGLLGFLH
ncbi:MAG: sodium-dependent transporter [Alistipes sp.]